MSKLDLDTNNRRELWIIVDSINTQGTAHGYESIAEAAYSDYIETLADEETAFDCLDDIESRLGLNLSEERAALTELFLGDGLLDVAEMCPECERSNGPHYRGPCEH